MLFKRGILIAFLALAALVFPPYQLKADVGVKSEVMDNALKQAQDKPESQGQTVPVSLYRQKLKEIITEEEEEEKYPWEWDSFARYIPARSLKAQDGKISIIDSESELSYTFKAGGKLPIQLSLVSQYISIHEKDFTAVSLPNHLTGLSFGIQGTLPFFFDKTYLRLKVMPSYFSQNWNTKSASFKLPSQAYLIYQPNEKWTFVGGIAAFPGYESVFAPIAGFIYKPNDQLVFNIVPSEPEVTYKFNDLICVFVNGGLSGGEYRVTKDGYKGAVLRYNELHMGGGLTLSPNKNIDLILSCGYMFNRYLKYRDSLGKASIKNSVYSELRVEMRI